tara:strand:+ start:164 stop:1018 length:855 start_codon:yes stop_codon:yes gene_type:complete
MGIYLGATELSTGGGGGGGGLLNIKRYSTTRANSTTFPNQQALAASFHLTNDLGAQGNITVMNTRLYTAVSANQLAGITVSWNGTTNATILSHPAGALYASINITYASGIGSAAAGASIFPIVYDNITVNPASDLGLVDGAKLGYFMVGAGEKQPTSQDYKSGAGGYILQGTAIIGTASTDLTLTIAESTSATNTFIHSTISGGLTLTTANGTNATGWSAYQNSGNYTLTAGPGINGYGAGGNLEGIANTGGAITGFDGYGGGGNQWQYGTPTNGSDGSIALYY